MRQDKQMEHGRSTRTFTAITVIGFASAMAGAFISAALILEYFGISFSLTEAVCRSDGGVNACRTVAKSAFAAIRGLPLLGDIPTALFGFIYYCYAALLFAVALGSGARSGKAPLVLTALLSIPALTADLFLFFFSAMVIRAYCPLCMASYVATLLILAAALLALPRYRKAGMDETGSGGMLRSLAIYLRKRLVTHGSALLIIAAVGLGLGLAARSSLAESMARFGGDERSSRLIERYESVLESRIDIEGAPFDGNPGSPVRIVVFSDFNCSSCTRMNTGLKRLLEERPNRVVIYYKNFPLGEQCRDTADHRKEVSSCLAARAALCAAKQGRYTAYSTALYLDCETGVEHDIRSLRGHAARVGLDSSDFDACMASNEALEHVRQDRLEGERLLVDGTPTLFVNNRMLDTADLDQRTLRALIEYITNRSQGRSR
jgi:protein-disulfide isomerase/uncharacterized membrane protein